jgi:hypothetical protein
MVCRPPRAISNSLNALFKLNGISHAATGGYMLNVIGKYDIPGAPAKSAMYALIGLGVFLTFLACLGMQGSALRKQEGSEGRGLCLLIIYAVLLFLVILVEVIVGVVVFVWLGGTLGPVTEKIENNDKAQKVVKKGTKQASNFINCVYDGCCITQEINATRFEFVGCYVDDKGMPDVGGSLYEGDDCTDYPCETGMESVNEVCGALGSNLLSAETCHAGIDTFKANVAEAINENIKPIGYVCVCVGSVQLILFVFAMLQICWCCGKSDPVEDWDDDYDEYGQVAY